MVTNETIPTVTVKLDPPEPCPACGTLGAHFCTGGQPQGGGWVGVQDADH